FKDWGGIFNDDVIAAAIIDRLLHHSHLFVINGPSYRIKDKVISNKVVENKEE
ncbi:MAG: AAA family ATPase, partial [Candidatus Cloacimonas sp. 4484_209]